MNQVDTFVQHRPLLFNIAYRMLGSAMDAEDMVQDSFLRWQRADPADVEKPRAYLTTVVTRLCIDYLRSARARRETYPGPWLPEPLPTERAAGPADTVALRESLSLAFLLLLERLSPAERAAFLLREVFAYEYGEVAEILDRRPAACRQLVSRARRKLERPTAWGDVSPFREQQAAMTRRLIETTVQGDMEGMLALLAEDVVLRSDGGGKVPAAMRPVRGADRVARFFLGLATRMPPDTNVRLVSLNGRPGLLILDGDRVDTAGLLEVRQGRIQSIYMVRNPDKLRAVAEMAR